MESKTARPAEGMAQLQDRQGSRAGGGCRKASASHGPAVLAPTHPLQVKGNMRFRATSVTIAIVKILIALTHGDGDKGTEL